ncbi:hypothetical protein CTheo_6253 [Ceratobasidium theobromae]|uniref:Uncharacterized protein n=1 Tax=Ceratobasidium theobromae TaxID=1582974 RepID=A0A5N5QEY7_9AGAM|nr:hypothetical protein CTheo_6253 [Ceratobasidium theobromae]
MTKRSQIPGLGPQRDYTEIQLPSDPRAQVLAYQATHEFYGDTTRVSDVSVYFTKATWVKVGELTNPGNGHKRVEKKFSIGPSSQVDPDVGIIVGSNMWYHTIYAGDKLKYLNMKFGSERKEFNADEALYGGEATAGCNLGPGKTVQVYQRQYVFKFEAETITYRKGSTSYELGWDGITSHTSFEGTPRSDSFDATIKSNDFIYSSPPSTGARMVEMWPMCGPHSKV